MAIKDLSKKELMRNLASRQANPEDSFLHLRKFLTVLLKISHGFYNVYSSNLEYHAKLHGRIDHCLMWI